jgi:glycosyltransferase involved in cell wall biosynthesis
MKLSRVAQASKDWLLAGNIAMHCRGKVLQIGACASVIPSAISAFGHELYMADDKESIDIARDGAYSFGLPSRYAVSDSLESIPDGFFDTAVVGTLVSNGRQFSSTLKEACRLISNKGQVIFLVNGNRALEDAILDLPVRVVFSIPQRNNFTVYIGQKDGVVGDSSLQYIENSLNIESLFQPVPLEDLDATTRVTVIIPTYNRADLLPEALDSVLGQTYPNVELIVVNDGSTDNTEEVLEPYMEKINYLRQANRGVAAARNAGIKKASGRYVTVLDDDDIMLPRAVELMVRCIHRNPQVDVLFKNLFKFKHESTPRRIDKVISFPYLYDDELLPWFLHDWQGYGTPFIRRDCFQSVGLFREDLHRSEDHEMHIRMVRHFKVDFLHIPLTMVRMHNRLRKSGDGYFHPDQSDERGLEHGRLFFPDIYKTLTLEELVPSLKQSPDDVTLKVRAYCERGLIAALYLFGEEAVSDLKQARAFVKNADVSIPVKCFDKVLIMIKRLVNPKFKGSLKGVLKALLILMRNLSNGREIRRYLSQRCYWRGLEFLRTNKYHEGLAWLFYALRLSVGR